MIHIGIVIYSMTQGGTEKVTLDLINSFIKKKYTISLICLHREGNLLTYVNSDLVRIFEIGGSLNAIDIIKSHIKLKKLVKTERIDCILSMGEIPNVICGILMNIPTILVEHSTKSLFTAPEIYQTPKVTYWLAKKAYSSGKKILCVSDTIKNKLFQLNKTLNLSTIYNPIDINNIIKIKDEVIEYESPNTILISVGRLSPSKNFHLLIKAFANIRQIKDNVELWIVGEGSMRNNLEQYAKDLNITDNIVFWGQQSNPYKFMSKADIFVSSSDYEGFGLVLFESIICGCRVITTRSIDDFDSLITKNEGTIVPVGNEDQLTNAILNELEVNKKNEKIPQSIMNFSIETIANRYLEYIQNEIKK